MEIGLALSGGGVRAAAFHLGVLRRLADDDLLESVAQLSTVSGGSLVTAALFAQMGLRWPSSSQFRSQLFSVMRRLLTTTDLFSVQAIGWVGLLKFNIRLLGRRSEVLAALLKERWGVAGTLSDLPERPVWWINTTCVETGRNWRFSKREMGDWRFGRHYSPRIEIAHAAAASAAVPYVIGALAVPLPTDGWYRTDPATRQALERISPSATRVRLWDGGAYEILGLEALFKPPRTLIGCDFLICSDASGPLPPFKRSAPRVLFSGQLASPRLFDIASEQIRSLRSRMFVGALEARAIKGALVRMGNSVRDIDTKSGRERDQVAYDRFQADEEATAALTHPTALEALPNAIFDQIARHGYEVADATLTAYAPAAFPRSLDWT